MDRVSTLRMWTLFALLCVPMAPLSAQQAAVDADDSTAAEVAAPANEVETAQLSATAPDDPWYRQVSLAGNEVWRIFAMFASILLGLIVGRIIRAIVGSTQQSTESRGNHYRAAALGAVGRVAVPAACLIGLYIGLEVLSLNAAIESIVATVIRILSAILVAYALYALVDVADEWMKNVSEQTESKLDDMLRPMVRTSLRATIIILALVQIATILSDKPFEMNDFIEAGGYSGTVESVGFRSTRLRTLDGHVVTIPNGGLANESIKNISARPFLKRSGGLGLTYDTSPQQIEALSF